jgi:cell cycle sensor histidine kinase DivJ
MADRRAFSQILLNLVANAIKFTPRGGKVSVSARCDGGHLAVSVEDTGVGVGEDDLARLGEAFFQAGGSYDRKRDGAGLGLSIVKRLVELHGGDLDIVSRLGEGTRVTVRLPFAGGGKRAGDPINLVNDRAGALAAVAKIKVRKRA